MSITLFLFFFLCAELGKIISTLFLGKFFDFLISVLVLIVE